jgi:hypothetical protein
MPQDDEQLARLLSGRDQPSVLEKEAAFAAIYARVADRGRPAQRWPWALALSAAAAGLLMWGRFQSDSAPTAEEFRARGVQAAERFAISCYPVHGAPALDAQTSCAPGSRLALQLEPSAENHYLALFVRRSDGAIVWYFPSESEPMPDVAGEHLGSVWQKSALLAESSPPGTYTVFAVFAPRPLSRAVLKAALGDDLRGDGTLHVVSRELDVEAQP